MTATKESPFHTGDELIARFGEPDHLIEVKGKFDDGFCGHDVMEYAIWVNGSFRNRCMVAAHYGEDDWVINPSTTLPLIWQLLTNPINQTV